MESQLTKEKIQSFAKCQTALTAIFLYGLIRLLTLGFEDIIAINLVVGALVSFIILWGYRTALLKNQKSWFSAIVVFSNLLVVVFDLYVVFYLGVFYLIQGFSFLRLAQSLFLIGFGWRLINNLQSFVEKKNESELA